MPLTSLWVDRSRLDEPALTEAPELPARSDVVVVGAGITGLTAALLLSRTGRSVTVLEARHVGAGTTGGSTAKISLLQGTRLSTLGRKHGPGVVRRYVEANREGQAWLLRFCDDHGVPYDVRTAYTYAADGDGAGVARRELRTARRAGLDATWEPDLGLPFHHEGGVRLDGQAQVDPMAVLDALARETVRHGGRIVTGVRGRSVEGSAPPQVVTDAGSITADTVVLATGLPFLDRGGFFARMTPQRSYSLAFRTETAAVDGMYLSTGRSSRSLRDAWDDDLGHLLLVGGAGHVTGRTASPRARLDELRHWTAEWCPDAVETHAWSAQDFEPAHGLPFAGPVLPRAPDVLVAGGFSKWGMTNGVAAALALTARITGGHLRWADVLEPWRGTEVSGLPTAALANAAVGLEMAGGWLRPVRNVGDGEPSAPGNGVVSYRGPRPPVATAVDDNGLGHRRSAVCTHLGGVVRWNDAERSWDCPLHGSRFDADGSVLEGPATCGLRAGRPPGA
ncbi:FAD-dependent oxidoreductase [Nocardioides guangzhouensis]|uniref:FAD-dependent oxidoreductase n=1 Tax=Nocardioides guangzhouensis TaxID=2497878 RepID=A0A4Q4Z805_9ACTN|nr:FAD-dependent oxidoreductase [Nocardioides guangzhouensis]